MSKEFSARGLARLLGIDQNNIREWIRDGKLSVRGFQGLRYRIFQCDIASMAKEHPHHFHRAPDAALEQLFSPHLIELIKNSPSRTGRKQRYEKIRHIPTGEEFSTVAEAARGTGISVSSVYGHLRKKRVKVFEGISG